jgi:hypothetical protein
MSAVGVVIGGALSTAAAAGLAYGGYEGAKFLSGNFGEDDAREVGRAADTQGGREEERLAREMAATQGAQAGLQPYQEGGTNALQMQQALSGALGPEAQAQAYAALQSSPMFAQMLQQGETSLLQNASATGGLRGGNTQAAMATLGPQLLQQLAMQQFGQLGQLSGMGLQAAGQSGQFGLTGAGLQGATLGNLGAIEAGGILGQQAARSGFKREATQLGMQAAGTGLSLATGVPMGGGGVPPPTGQGGGF